MGLIPDRIKAFPRQLLNRISYNSNSQSNVLTTANAYGYGDGYDQLREHHEGRYSYHEYQRILEDTQVDVAVDILLKFLLSKNYTLTSNSDDPEDIEIYEFIQDMLDNMETPLRKVRKDMYTSIKYGYALLEKVFDINSDGRIIWKGLYGIHMKTLQNTPFVKNEDGEIEEIHQQSVNGSVNIPYDKIMHVQYNSEFDELYGNSILNRIAEYPKLKDKIITWLVTFLYRHESPVTYAKLAGNSQFKNDVLKMLDEIGEGRSSMTIGGEDELGTLESTHRGEAFFNSLNYFDNLIFRGLFLGNLLLGDGGQTGSYAQSNTQLTVANTIFDGIHEDMAYDMQCGIDEIVHWNFGQNAKSPIFSFEKFTKKDIVGLLNALQPYAQSMIIDTNSQWFQEVISKIVMELSDIKVDTQKVSPNNTGTDEDVDYGMQPPLPGQDAAEQIVAEQLEGII